MMLTEFRPDYPSKKSGLKLKANVDLRFLSMHLATYSAFHAAISRFTKRKLRSN